MTQEAIAEGLLAILACPVCLNSLEALELAEPTEGCTHPCPTHGLRCTGCGGVFPVIDGIPVLLAERALYPD